MNREELEHEKEEAISTYYEVLDYFKKLEDDFKFGENLPSVESHIEEITNIENYVKAIEGYLGKEYAPAPKLKKLKIRKINIRKKGLK